MVSICDYFGIWGFMIPFYSLLHRVLQFLVFPHLCINIMVSIYDYFGIWGFTIPFCSLRCWLTFDEPLFPELRLVKCLIHYKFVIEHLSYCLKIHLHYHPLTPKILLLYYDDFIPSLYYRNLLLFSILILLLIRILSWLSFYFLIFYFLHCIIRFIMTENYISSIRDS